MNRSIRTLAILVALVSAGGCGAEQTREGESRSAGLTTGEYVSTWPSMYLRGTMNGWGTTPMTLAGDHQWVAEVTTGDTGDERFKLDVHGDWRLNFGDDEGDQIADRNGRDIPLEAGKTLLIHFSDDSNFYWIEPRTWQAEVTFRVPAGVDPAALAGKQARLFVDDQDYGANLIYFVDAEGGRAYAPLCCLLPGPRYLLRVDAIVGQERLVGEVSWAVDRSVDPIALTVDLAKASLEDHGAVELTVLSDRWENGAMVSSAYAGVTVYRGDWHAGDVLGATGADGKLSFMLPAGTQLFSAMIATSSHSIATAASTVEVVAGSFVRSDIHMAPLSVVVRAHYDTGVGKALYITGASDYLGDWEWATKMAYDPAAGAWTFAGNLPLGLPFKIALGPWVDEATIDTALVTWEQGPDRAVTPPNGYVSSQIEIWPSF